MSVLLPKGIFFDWDGTLVNTIPVLLRAHNYACAVIGAPAWSIDDFYGHMKYSSLELYPRLYGDRSKEALDALYGYMNEHHLNGLEDLNGAMQLVEFLAAQNVGMGVVSNKKHELLLREVDHFSWGKHLPIRIGAGHAKADKPSAEPLLLALQESGLSSNDIWYVGDTVTDMLVAKHTGCKAVLITGGDDKREIIEEFKPFQVFENALSFYEYLSA